jgi:hypothetical protein
VVPVKADVHDRLLWGLDATHFCQSGWRCWASAFAYLETFTISNPRKKNPIETGLSKKSCLRFLAVVQAKTSETKTQESYGGRHRYTCIACLQNASRTKQFIRIKTIGVRPRN